MRLLLALLLTTTLPAQWEIQDSHTTASLRGIHALGGGVAWASGTEGTVLRTTDDGTTWQTCPTPPAAEHLDFRGIQAFDQNTALVMSSGKGDLSRLYKTTDGCRTWKLIFTNPDPTGFYDALKMVDTSRGIVLGDPAKALSPVEAGYLTFRIRITADGGSTWVPVVDPRTNAAPGSGLWPFAGEALFAASNTSLAVTKDHIYVGTSGGRILSKPLPASFSSGLCAGAMDPYSRSCGIPWMDWTNTQTSMLPHASSAGIFSLANGSGRSLVAVGGDYTKPAEMSIASFTIDGSHWHPAQTPPHGYRSAVAYSPAHKVWITVGPNGTDLSTDDGNNWRALEPGKDDAPGADRDWNALSLPFVVGPKGRIGRLKADALRGLREP